MKANKIVNVFAFALIFVAPIIVVMARYDSGEQTIVVDEGMGFLATALITLIVIATTGLLVFHLKELMRDSFALSILVYGIIGGGLILVSYIATNYVASLATTNYEKFIESVNYHIDTMFFMLLFIGAGLLSIGGQYILKLAKKIKP